MSKPYRLSPAASEQDTNRALVRSLSFIVLLLLVPLFFMIFTGQLSDSRVFALVLTAEALFIAFFIWRTIRRMRRMLKNAVETYELVIDDQMVIRTQRECPTVTISRADIRRISERAGQGFRIETASSRQCIWVPKELEGYEELKTLLVSSTPEQAKTMQYPLAITYSMTLLFVAGFFIVIYSQRRSLVITTGIAVLCFYGYYVTVLVRTWQNLSRTMKRSLWTLALPALIVVSRIASVWR